MDPPPQLDSHRQQADRASVRLPLAPLLLDGRHVRRRHLQRLKADYGFDLNVEQLLADGHEFLEEHLAKDVTARHEVVAVVHHVRGLGHKTAVASAGRRDHVHTTLKRIDITHLFDAVITAEDAPRSKPHPDLFLAAADRLGLKPADCVVIEDSPRGKEAADAAGMPCILVEPA